MIWKKLRRKLPKRTNSGEKWRSSLASWDIPNEILAKAEESPWIHPPVLFEIPKKIEDSPSHKVAREALPEGGSVLDIGCGGGIAAFALVPKVKKVIGIDHQSEMLEMFIANARRFNCEYITIEGFWPEVSDQTPSADLVVSHHVAYNVPNIEEFLIAMNDKAKKRIVIEIPQQHPLTNMNQMWSHFWGISRPTEPSADLLFATILELGFPAKMDKWSGEMRGEIDLDQAAEFNRIRLCLPKSKLGEVRAYIEANPPKKERTLATIWWDK